MSSREQLLVLDIANLDPEKPGFDRDFGKLREAARDIAASYTPAIEHSAATYAAGPAEAIAQGAYTHGPEHAIWELGPLPDGHVVHAMDRNEDVMIVGLVKGGTIDWEHFVNLDRRAVADDLYENADFGCGPDGTDWTVLDAGGWETDMQDTWRRPVFVEPESLAGASSLKKILTIRFLEGSSEIDVATFDGHDIHQPEPGNETPDLFQGDF